MRCRQESMNWMDKLLEASVDQSAGKPASTQVQVALPLDLLPPDGEQPIWDERLLMHHNLTVTKPYMPAAIKTPFAPIDDKNWLRLCAQSNGDEPTDRPDLYKCWAAMQKEKLMNKVRKESMNWHEQLLNVEEQGRKDRAIQEKLSADYDEQQSLKATWLAEHLLKDRVSLPDTAAVDRLLLKHNVSLEQLMEKWVKLEKMGSMAPIIDNLLEELMEEEAKPNEVEGSPVHPSSGPQGSP
eukprot:GHVS01097286.1.p1 GENE.GHVS01097286.1~~GHVS01097286.1.p1  ORF type:complete len:240 (-),score=60.53 GHVS01097286.1:39-758(-)